MKNKAKLFTLLTASLLLVGCGSATSSQGTSSSVTSTSVAVSSVTVSSATESSVVSSSEEKKEEASSSGEEEAQSVIYTANLKKIIDVNFYNSLYQGAGDSFLVEDVEAFSDGVYELTEGSTDIVAEITGSWLKLTFVADGSYTLSDTLGYNMTESGTWTLENYKLSVALPTPEEEEKDVRTVMLKDSITVSYGNALYQGAGDTFAIDWPNEFESGSYTAVEGDGDILATFGGSWLQLDLAKDGTYHLSDNLGYNMTESGTWTFTNNLLKLTQPGETGKTFTASPKANIAVAFSNALYQGAGDTFFLDGIEAFAGSSYAAVESSTDVVAEITGSWLKLTLVADGSYTMKDTLGYNMSESGTWSYAGYKLSIIAPAK